MKFLAKIYSTIRYALHGYGLKRFFFVKAIDEFIINLLKTHSPIEVLSHKMYLDSKDSLNLSINGCYEEFETKLIMKEVKEGDYCLDIGANIGYYTLILAKLVGRQGKVFAFEPDPTNFKILKKNIKTNKYNNVVLINQAVSDITGNIKLYLNSTYGDDHRTYDSKDGRNFISIKSLKLDDYFINNRHKSFLQKAHKVDFIKMDIQGAEYSAIEGMSNLLKTNKQIRLISEFWPIGLKRSGINPTDFLNSMLKLGFVIEEVNETEKIKCPTDISGLLAKYTTENENYTNLFFYRPSTEISLISPSK